MRLHIRHHALTLGAALALLAAFSFTLPAAAQPAPDAAPAASPAPGADTAPTFGEQVEVTEVLIDAQVTDRAGNVIVGLGPGDFHVEEGGKPVPVTNVTFYSSRPQLTASGSQAAPAESQRFFILFFHDQRNMNTEVPGVLTRELDAGRRAREWVKHLAAGDLVAVAVYNTSLIIEQDFTNDPALLQKGIDRAVRGGSASGNWPSRLPPEGAPSLLRNLPKGKGVRDASTTIYGGFETLARAGKPIIGRKNVILFSSGFGDVNSFGQYVPNSMYDEPAIQELNDGNVAIYAVDVLNPNTESPLQSSLSNFADTTGGRFIHNQITFDSPLRQIAEETSGYYLLAYRATHPHGAKGYQKVKVTLPNPELRVKAREGYMYGE